MIIIDLALLAIGFAALTKGADIFVDGSAAIARRFHVPGMIIGLTIVALGTSAPELAVSTSSAIQGANELALSNVVGSNIFNLLCVLGVCALFHPVPVAKKLIVRDFSVSIIMTILVFLFTSVPALYSGILFRADMSDNIGILNRLPAAFLLLVFVAYIVYLIKDAIRHPSEDEDAPDISLGKSILFIIFGLALIIGGGQAVVYSAKEIAREMGMTETLIGLTIVAVGTSLPELVTSVVAAKKGETEMAVGNVIGSNIFNLLFILGVSALIRPIAVNAASAYDLVILFSITVMTLIFAISGKKINRIEGIVMILIYIADVCFAALR